jgi:tol-pal system protein YbgF
MSKLAFLVAALGLSACWYPQDQGDALRKDVTTLQGRIDNKEKSLDEEIAQLHSVLDDATKVLKRNSADLGADVDQLRADVRTANGLVTAVNAAMNDMKTQLEALKKSVDGRFDVFEARISQLETGKPATNSSGDDLWRLGSQAFEGARYTDAIEIFKRLVQQYPQHPRAADAVYFRGQSYTNLKDWDHAITTYKSLYETYPTSQLADDGLYFAAMAAQQLKNCDESRTYIALLKQKYPKSNVIRQADELDAQVKKDRKSSAKCTQ